MPHLHRIACIVIVALCVVINARAASNTIPIVLSTDVGNEIDDQWAILYVLTNPRFDVKGLLSAHAPSMAPPAAHTSVLLLRDIVEKRLKMSPHPPILEGASLPLASKTAVQPSDAVDFLIKASREYTPENRLTVFAIGAVTDVASAILKDPTFVDRVRIIQMGFDSWAKGGQEYNIQNDPVATQVLLASKAQVVVGAGDVCKRTLALTYQQAHDLVAQHGPLGKWLWEDYQAWYYRHVKPLRKNDFSKPWIIWDIITMAYAVDMATTVEYARPVLNDDLTFAHPQTTEKILWIDKVETEKLWADFLDRLDEYQRTHDVGQ